MRLCLPLVLLAVPALADVQVAPADCPAQAVGCFLLSDLAASPGRPVVVGDTLVLAGLGRGPTGTRDRLMAVDIDLTGAPRLGAITVLDATRTEAQGQVEIAPDGAVYAVFTGDERDHLNRNRAMGAIQFFDESGQRLGRIAAPYAPDWPEDAEWTPVDLYLSHARTNALRFGDGVMSLRFGRFQVSSTLADGAVTVTDQGEGAGDADVIALADEALGGAGFQHLWMLRGLTAMANYPFDGSPATLRLARTPASDPPDVLGHVGQAATVVEPNADDYSRVYESIALSPDGSRLAALLVQDEGCGAVQAGYRITVYDTVTGARLWSHSGVKTGIAQQDLTWIADQRLVLTEAHGALDPPCGPDPAPPAVSVTLFDPRPAP